MTENDKRVATAVRAHGGPLRRFVRRYLRDPRDVQDVVQDVFAELAEANALLVPIDHVAAWLFRVARNRITDLLRKKTPEPFSAIAPESEDGERLRIEDWLPSEDAGPAARYARDVLVAELERALAELPPEQRAVFVAHELEGKTFREMSEATGVGLNTLLARKRYAVLHLRARLSAAREAFEDDLEEWA